MNNNVHGIGISRETFEKLDSAARELVIFDALKSISGDVKELKEKEKVNKKEVMWIGGTFGFIGGILVTLAKLFLP